MLDQAEIDALLSSVEAQNAPFDEDGVIQIFSRYRREAEPIELREYDFRRPERIRREELHALDVLHESFARNLSALLTPFLRSMTEVSLAQVEQMTFAEFVTGMPSPTAFALLQSPALPGSLGLEISPLIVYPMIDRLLGGSAQELHIPKRPLTAIESRLAKLILAKAAGALSDAWAVLPRAAHFVLGEVETSPHLAIFASPNEVVLVARFDVRLLKRGGGMALCIPIRVIEAALRELCARSGLNTGAAVTSGGRQPGTNVSDNNAAVNGVAARTAGHYEMAIAARLARAKVNISAVLANTSITVRQMQSLSVGDIIATNRPAGAPAVVCVEGRPHLSAALCDSRGRRCVEIVD